MPPPMTATSNVFLRMASRSCSLRFPGEVRLVVHMTASRLQYLQTCLCYRINPIDHRSFELSSDPVRSRRQHQPQHHCTREICICLRKGPGLNPFLDESENEHFRIEPWVDFSVGGELMLRKKNEGKSNTILIKEGIKQRNAFPDSFFVR